MTNVNQKAQELRLEIEQLEADILDVTKEEGEITSALLEAQARKDQLLRVRLANIAALTALEQEKFQ